CCQQRFGKAGRVRPDLALVYDAALVPVKELDRVLDGEDVLRAVPVDLVDERRERRRLTGAGRPGDEDEPTRLLGEDVQRVRDAELLQRLQLRRNETERGADRLALEVDVDTEARETRNRVREVELAVELEVLLLLAREDPIQQLLRLFGRERVVALESLHFPAHANSRGRPRRHMQVGGVRLHHAFEQLVYRVGRGHNSNESSACPGASFTRFAAQVSNDRESPVRGLPTVGDATDQQQATSFVRTPWKEHVE